MIKDKKSEEIKLSYKEALKRAFGIILPLCMLSILIAGAVCSVANDMYAFVKKDREVTIEIREGTSLSEFSKMLAKNDIVDNPTVFCLYVRSKKKTDKIENFSGEVTLDRAMSYREIVSSIS